MRSSSEAEGRSLAGRSRCRAAEQRPCSLDPRAAKASAPATEEQSASSPHPPDLPHVCTHNIAYIHVPVMYRLKQLNKQSGLISFNSPSYFYKMYLNRQ